jgi:hypothetical protein
MAESAENLILEHFVRIDHLAECIDRIVCIERI